MTDRPKTHNDRVLHLLRDGKWHTHHELYALHVIAHSRVADLRRKGYAVAQRRNGDHYEYRLVQPTTSTEAEDSPPSVSADAGPAPTAVQLPLLPMVEAPPWA